MLMSMVIFLGLFMILILALMDVASKGDREEERREAERIDREGKK